MDWNQITQQWKGQKGLNMSVSDWLNQPGSEEGLLDKVRERDKKDQRMIKGFVKLLSFATALLTVAIFLNPDPDIMENYSTRAMAACEILAFTLFIPYGYKKLIEYRSNLSSFTLLEFLEYGEKRFAFWRKDNWVLIPYMLLLGAALNFSILGNYWGGFSWDKFAILNGAYLLLIAVSLFFSYRNWKKKHFPILQQMRQIRQEMQD